jgi:hypothetical protein
MSNAVMRYEITARVVTVGVSAATAKGATVEFNTLAAACQVTGEIAAVPGDTAEPLTTGRARAASPNSPA